MKKLAPALIALFALMSCSKSATENQQNNTPAITATAAYTGSTQLRKLDLNLHKCVDIVENCHPEDVVIKSDKLDNFKAAIDGGAAAVATYFGTSEALDLIPAFDETFFAATKTKILSGNYTFIADDNNDEDELYNQIYYLVPDSNPIASAQEYVFVYQVD